MSRKRGEDFVPFVLKILKIFKNEKEMIMSNTMLSYSLSKLYFMAHRLVPELYRVPTTFPYLLIIVDGYQTALPHA